MRQYWLNIEDYWYIKNLDKWVHESDWEKIMMGASCTQFFKSKRKALKAMNKLSNQGLNPIVCLVKRNKKGIMEIGSWTNN